MKYLWGNVPAIDVLNLQGNEGLDYTGDFRLLFGASGDCRNLIKAIGTLPPTYTGACEVVMNDKDIAIVARNALLLLVAFLFDPEIAAPVMLHLWYSAFVPAELLSLMRENILPLIQDICSKIEPKPPTKLFSKTWVFENRSLSLALPKQSWTQLLSYFEVPSGLSTTAAKNLRVSTTLHPDRMDYVDRGLFNYPPGQRVAMRRFREDGILLPFGTSRGDYDTPNPTFFQDKESWPMKDNADPLAGWSWQDITPSTTSARNDIYGHLCTHLYSTLLRFCRKCRQFTLKIRLFQTDILALPDLNTDAKTPQQGGFDRIEVSNVIDGGYIGTAPILSSFAPLLKPPHQNPHATLIGLYLNAVHEASTSTDQIVSMAEELTRVRQYMPITPCMLSPDREFSAELLRMLSAREFFRDLDALFERYCRMLGIEGMTQAAGMVMKGKNTVVEKWPMRLGPRATQEEFDKLLASMHDGSERYVEWQRVG
ncbi:MAG: hypothetical protein Q9184_001434 [Pyrenodesmia sp. 2 TL-2023]